MPLQAICGGYKQLKWEDKDLHRLKEVFSELYGICEHTRIKGVVSRKNPGISF